jgi:hypothetical protein
MKRLLACVFLIALCGFTGCFTAAPPKVLEREEPTALAEPHEAPRLTADQINPGNVSEKTQEFVEELDRAEKRQLLKTPH